MNGNSNGNSYYWCIEQLTSPSPMASATLANGLCNISLANLRACHPGLHLLQILYTKIRAVFSLFAELQRQSKRKLNWHLELQEDGEGEGAVDTAVVIQVKLPATC